MKTLFAPGCALRRHRPGSIERISRFLMQRGITDKHPRHMLDLLFHEPTQGLTLPGT